MDRRIVLGGGAALVALIAGTFAFTALRPNDAFAACREGVAGGDIGGPFELVSETGETVTDADVITEPTILYFGYTFCPDVCPLDVNRNAIATDIASEAGRDVQSVFVTVDPARDTPEVMAAFTDNFSDTMLGLTGSDEQVRAAADAYRVFYRQAGDDPDYYLMDHTTFSYLVLPEHGVVDFFRRDATPEEVAERAICFADAA